MTTMIFLSDQIRWVPLVLGAVFGWFAAPALRKIPWYWRNRIHYPVLRWIFPRKK